MQKKIPLFVFSDQTGGRVRTMQAAMLPTVGIPWNLWTCRSTHCLLDSDSWSHSWYCKHRNH